ncbi:hypothetical protein BGZ57DRAFT_1015788 [Hyaloscypha finlandica]|nr:hypothetical protein BGZ57DRAFT_1015788 [Hyaloscypha finlandica]
MVVGHIYIIVAVAVVGGGLFGFDTSLMAIGSILVCASQNIGMFIEGRIVNGLVSIESAQVSAYVAEPALPSKRGRFVGAQQWAITWGIMIVFYGVVIPILSQFPASDTVAPSSAANSNYYDTAAFRVPWGNQIIPTIGIFFAMIFLPEESASLFVMLELEDIRNMCEFDRVNKDVTCLDLFKPAMLNQTTIAVFIQLTGMNVMTGYSGNANLLMFANAGILGGQGVAAPCPRRRKGVALVTSSNWAFNLALWLVPLPAFVNIKWNVYLIFGIFKGAMFIHVFFMFPETSGKTPEETENMFEDPNGPRVDRHATMLEHE